MQRSRVRARATSHWFATAPIALAAAFSTGCGGDDSYGGATSTTTASSAGGSGAEGGHSGTGGAGGATGQGGDGGAAPGPVPLLVRDQLGNPLAGISVVINDAAGAVAAPVLTTDASGTVEVTVPLGGSASVFHTEGLAYRIHALYDVPPGTPMVFDLYIVPPPPSTPATTYSIYPSSYPPGTTELELHGTCVGVSTQPGSKFPSVDNASCSDTPQDFLSVAHSATGAVIGWNLLESAPTNPGGVVDLSVALTDTSVSTIDVSLTAIPAGATEAYVSANLAKSHVYTSTSTPPVAPGGSTVSGSIVLPNIAGATFGWAQGVSVDTSPDVGSSMGRSQQGPALPANASFSADSFTWISVNPLDTSDAAHPTVTWSSTKQPVADDAFVHVGWTGGSSTFDFSARLPAGGATSLRLADIPDELASYRPAPTSVFGGAYVYWEELDVVNGFADVCDGVTLDEMNQGMTYSGGWNYLP